MSLKSLSRFSLRRERIEFQVLKFFPHGGSSYANFILSGAALEAHTLSASSSATPTVEGASTHKILTGATSVAGSMSLKDKGGVEAAVLIPVGEDAQTANLTARSTPPQDVIDTVARVMSKTLMPYPISQRISIKKGTWHQQQASGGEKIEARILLQCTWHQQQASGGEKTEA